MEGASFFLSLRDFISILTTLAVVIASYYALRKKVEVVDNKITELEGKQEHDTNTITTAMAKQEKDINDKIIDLKSDHKKLYERVDQKIDNMSSQMNNVEKALSELTGYIRAKEK